MKRSGVLIEQFAARVIADNPTHSNFLRSALQNASTTTLDQLADYIEYCISSGLDLEYLAASYNTITIDTQMEQIFFQRHGRYRWSKFSEVAENVYFNPEYMKKYMYGLALTAFLWPNHTAIHEFFRRTFPSDATGSYLEIGPGHGYYFMQSAKLGKFTKLIGIDISSASVALTQDIIRHYGVDPGKVVEIIEADFLAFETPERFSMIVMGEVLEHVEEPMRFLRKIAGLSEPQTHIYITTCVNAPAVDHIYLFRHPEEIEDMARSSGLAVVDRFCGPYTGMSIEESLQLKLPINVAFVLRAQ